MEPPGRVGGPVERFYSRWAWLYDLVASRTPGIARVRQRAVDALAVDAGATVVEMGCGTGANLPYLRDTVGPGGRVVGVDIAEGALGRAASRVARSRWENVSLLRGDATRPPIDRADALRGTFVVGMVEDPGGAVDRWCDIVGPGGRVALLNATRSDRSTATPINLAFRGFVRLGAPGKRLARGSPAMDLEAKIERAGTRLQARCEDVRRESLAGGYLRLASGRVSD